jgi:hypothetical protein
VAAAVAVAAAVVDGAVPFTILCRATAAAVTRPLVWWTVVDASRVGLVFRRGIVVVVVFKDRRGTCERSEAVTTSMLALRDLWAWRGVV